MSSIADREQNLFRATAALAQFYDEIESFLQILRDSMAEAEFGSVAWRLRSGTFSYANLTRRLLATATIMYFRGEGDQEVEDEDAGDEAEEEEAVAKRSVVIDPQLRIPFVTVWLFGPKVIPSMRNLSSPQLIIGAMGNFAFRDKRTQQAATLDKPELAVSNLAQLFPKPSNSVGDHITMNCWRPAAMKKYALDAEIVALEKQRLLDVDSPEKVHEIARKMASFCEI